MSELITAFDVLAASTEEHYSIATTLEKALQKNATTKPPIVTRGEKKPFDPNQLLNLSISASDLGRQITLIDYSLFKLIQDREYLKETWKTRKVSNIRILHERCEELTRWVATSIVKLESKEARANLISKFVDVAQQCLNLKNFSGFFGIIKAFLLPSIERLTQTWLIVKPHVMTTLKSFQQIMSKADHYRNYKSKQEASIPPCVPYLDIHLEEISYIDSFNPDIGTGGIINFTKHRKIARLVRILDQYKTASYTDLHPIESIQQLLLNSQTYDEDNLQKRSLNCERPASFG